jgi:hypothetical protein
MLEIKLIINLNIFINLFLNLNIFILDIYLRLISFFVELYNLGTL